MAKKPTAAASAPKSARIRSMIAVDQESAARAKRIAAHLMLNQRVDLSMGEVVAEALERFEAEVIGKPKPRSSRK